MPYTLEEQIRDLKEDISDADTAFKEAHRAMLEAIEWYMVRGKYIAVLEMKLEELLKQK